MKNTMVWALFASFLLCGCASVSVTGLSENPEMAPRAMPSAFSVGTFFSAPDLEGGGTVLFDPQTKTAVDAGRSPSADQTEAGLKLSDSILRQWKRSTGQTGHATGLGKSVPNRGLFVTGQIVRKKPGSRFLRAAVGLGTGKSEFDVRTVVYNADKSVEKPWLTIWTRGHSGSEPGAIFAAVPSPVPLFNIAGAVGFVAAVSNGANKGLCQDAGRTGKVIGIEIGDRLALTAPSLSKKRAKDYLPGKLLSGTRIFSSDRALSSGERTLYLRTEKQ